MIPRRNCSLGPRPDAPGGIPSKAQVGDMRNSDDALRETDVFLRKNRTIAVARTVREILEEQIARNLA